MKYVLIVLLLSVGCFKSAGEIQMEMIATNAKNINRIVKIMTTQSKTTFLINKQVRRMDKEIRLLKEERR